ncbi:TDH_3 [Blepharisma stoltei]|uniref:NAD-dependent epimerase/dehydratase domain-containing protein n=1 Tax=Blepharisma stoltei TaxID=1481888 RepID=A0AAU9J3Z5_9CILI|nr:unnamed protein product [Blepharisma stoltei]
MFSRISRNFSSRKFFITGASGQIGKKLIPYLFTRYGPNCVVVSDVNQTKFDVESQPPFIPLDVVNKEAFIKAVETSEATDILHLAAYLSAKAELQLQKSIDVNILGLNNALEAARINNTAIYVPSSIAVFGPTSPRVRTPDDCVVQPTTAYGISKVYMELMGNYYHKKFGVNFRSLRYPGAISSDPPGGGTTDYAVEIYFELLKNQKYECFLSKGTELPMMYIDDLIEGTCDLLDAPEETLTRRVYNLGAISFTPEQLASCILKYIPGTVTYKSDHRQAYADSWPMSIDDSLARRDWNWKHKFDMDIMTRTMIKLICMQMGKPNPIKNDA